LARRRAVVRLTGQLRHGNATLRRVDQLQRGAPATRLGRAAECAEPSAERGPLAAWRADNNSASTIAYLSYRQRITTWNLFQGHFFSDSLSLFRNFEIGLAGGFGGHEWGKDFFLCYS